MSFEDERAQNESDGGKCEGGPALTRRQWLLRLGEAAALVGFNGGLPEELLESPTATVPAEASLTLPPGLYEASSEHMAHALGRIERYVTPPPGSETEYARPIEGAFKPTFFTTEDFSTVRQLVRLMLNASVGPGGPTGPTGPAGKSQAGLVDDATVDEVAEWVDLATADSSAFREAARSLSAPHRELAVHYYGEAEVRKLESDDPQRTWREGLEWVKLESSRRSAASFTALTEVAQVELLASLAATSNAESTANAGERLFRLLKNQAIEGYYTSKAGLEELDYKGNAFYPESPGCPKD